MENTDHTFIVGKGAEKQALKAGKNAVVHYSWNIPSNAW